MAKRSADAEGTPAAKKAKLANQGYSVIPASHVADRTVNPIRSVVENLKAKPNPDLAVIPLSIGDPTVFGNFRPPEFVLDKLTKIIKDCSHNGYRHSAGIEDARSAIAEKFSVPNCKVSSTDVVLASGCSGALELAFAALLNEGQNVLLPRPGFSLYETLANSKGFEVKYYDLVPEKNWELDLEHMESLIDANTAAILVNNPSNPCGAVYSKSHLQAILAVAEKYGLPVIADEIYDGLVFEGNAFFPLASLTDKVPVIATGGLAKRFMVPGWRIGWVVVYDRNGILEKVRQALFKLSQLILGPSVPLQALVRPMLLETPASYHQSNISILQEHASICYKTLNGVRGLKCIKPQGAMYMMIGLEISQFKDIADDKQFSIKLEEEKSVKVLPGSCFKYPNYFRIVITAPKEKLTEAAGRIKDFCASHYAN